jgi:leucyl-tRNA synthetase
VRGRLRATAGLSRDEAVKLALADQGVQRFVDDGEIKKAIYVPDRLVNLVVSSQ